MRQLDNRYAILFIRGAKPVMDLKYDLMRHPAIRHTVDGGSAPYVHHHKHAGLPGNVLFLPEAGKSTFERKDAEYEEKHPESDGGPDQAGI